MVLMELKCIPLSITKAFHPYSGLPIRGGTMFGLVSEWPDVVSDVGSGAASAMESPRRPLKPRFRNRILGP